MRKFRLIKEYPGSPKIGAIHSDENKVSNWMGYNLYTEYTEYWEEIKDVCYITSLTGHENKNIYVRYCKEKTLILSVEHDEVERNEFKIVSLDDNGGIKTIIRLSDLTYFSIGDWIYPTKEKLQPNIIMEFKYVLNGEFRVFGSNSCVPLEYITPTKNKAKQYKISGNMLYSWNKVWGVHNKSFNKNFVKYGREDDGVPVSIAITEENYTWFTSKEEAIDFIIQHKPCFSLEDINKEISTDNSKFRMLHNFYEISKSRI